MRPFAFARASEPLREARQRFPAMAKPKPTPKPKGSKAAKAARPFLVAFALTVGLALLAMATWVVYGLDGYTPRVSLSGWPAMAVLLLVALAAFAYWRGGKAAMWGVLIAVSAVGLALAILNDAIPYPF